MRLAAALTALFLLAAPALAQDRAIIVLDASGSMWGQIDGRSKIEIARETLAGVLGTLPPERELGLIAYGHRSKGDCADIELVVPPAAGNGPAIAEAANRLNPLGKTPLTDAVRQAAEALQSTEDKATVILVTDGLETCEADPCALAAKLETSGVDFTAHVVGFGLTAEEGAQVACLAEATGGRYLQASDAGALAEALRETVVAAPEPEPVPEPQPEPEPAPPAMNLQVTSALREACDALPGEDSRVRWDVFHAAPEAQDGLGAPVEGGYAASFGMALDPGDYVLVASANDIQRQMPFAIAEGEQTDLHIDWDAAPVKIRITSTPGATELLEGARLDLVNGDWTSGGYTSYDQLVPAGTVRLTGSMGAARAEATLTVVAGQPLEHELVIGSGWITPVVLYAEGGPPVEDSGMRFDIRPASGGEPVQGGYGQGTVDVPAGEMIVEVSLGQARAASQPVTVAAGQTVEAPILLNAGVLAIAAPGADRIDLLAAKGKINGDRDSFGGGYGEAYQDTLHLGDYLIRVTYAGDLPPKEATATVTAGERTEITVE
ncbi:VWA domain-containing protein [uncultured Paracoccus sp.]|uniref:vWA domain-containing protein n=1 Tax=uncultured Paracoccus sp. TaxID=189685 RepID=UPI00261A48CE|nr:VWA domain-containing protein [uncultured Paracoccus sp.]